MKNRLLSTLLTLTLMPLFGYANITKQAHNAQLLTHLQSSKKDILNDLRKIEAGIHSMKEEFGKEMFYLLYDIYKEFLNTDNQSKKEIEILKQLYIDTICNEMKSLYEVRQMVQNATTMTMVGLYLNGSEQTAEEIAQMDLFASIFTKHHTKYCQTFPKNVQITSLTFDDIKPNFDLLVFPIIINEMQMLPFLLEKIENKIKELENQA